MPRKNFPDKSKENMVKYLKAPTIAEINKALELYGTTISQTERFFGMPAKTLRKARAGKRNLPTSYWHVIFEKIPPDQPTKTPPEPLPNPSEGVAKAGSLALKLEQAPVLPKENPPEEGVLHPKLYDLLKKVQKP